MVSIPESARVALYIASLIGAIAGEAYEDTDTMGVDPNVPNGAESIANCLIL